MSRKNLLEISSPNGERPEPAPHRNSRPLAGLAPTVRSGSPVGGITKTLGNITEKMERATDLERQLAQGQTIVEIDPALVDASFVADRLEIDPVELAQLVEQIREHGQQVPVLLRPHPEAKSRYQVAYGHRRLAATRMLGIKVRAVIRELTDEQLVVSQGQENSARTNLSFIERALFAARLEERGFGRDVIMASLGVDKAALSKMMSVVSQVPMAVLTAIGAAPDVGRRRWAELAERLTPSNCETIATELSADNWRALSSPERFQRALEIAQNKEQRTVSAASKAEIPGLPVTLKTSAKSATFVFDNKAAPGFDRFVQERLSQLFAEYQQQQGA